MGYFDNLVRSLDQMGVTEVVLPFLLMFILIYLGTLKSKIFADKKHSLIVSLIISFLVIIPHVLGKYPRNVDPVILLNGVLPHIVLVLFAFLVLSILFGFLGGESPFSFNSWWLFIGGLIFVVWLFGEEAGWFTTTNLSVNLQGIIGEDALTVLVMLIVFIGVIWFIVSEGGSGDPNDPNRQPGLARRAGQALNPFSGGGKRPGQ